MFANSIFYNRHTDRKALLLAVAAAALIGNGAYAAWQTLTAKAADQQQSLSQIVRWKAEYDLLKPVGKDWAKTVADHTTITDLYRVNAALQLERHGLTTDPMKLVVDRIEPAMHNGASLGAMRLCLKTAGEHGGVALTAPTFWPDLLRGLSAFAERRDIQTGNISLTSVNNTPKAVVDLCLLLRS